MILLIYFSALILAAILVFFYFKIRFYIPLKQIVRLVKILIKNNVNYLTEIELDYPDKKIKQLHKLLIELVEIVNQKEVNQRMVEKNLRYNEIKYREMTEFLPQCIFEANENQLFTYVNKTGIELFGYSKEEMKNLEMNIIFRQNDIDCLYSGFDSAEVECMARHKNGSVFPVILFVSAIVKGTKLSGIRTVVIDETARKKHIEELETAKARAEEASKMKTAFLANMSHEIRTPMTAILGFSNLLNKKNLNDESKQQYITHINSAGEHLLKLIDDIIDVARIESGEYKINKTNFNLNSFMTEIKTTFAQKAAETNKHIDVIFTGTNTDEFFIYTDPLRLKQILYNLMGNALKYTNKGHVKFGYEVSKEQVQFYIIDTGIGIPLHLHEAIFDRFHQIDYAKSFGNGLGLTITKSLVGLLGGTIWLTSEVGKGSKFHFTVSNNPPLNNKIKNTLNKRKATVLS